jgi:hypothetical protein
VQFKNRIVFHHCYHHTIKLKEKNNKNKTMIVEMKAPYVIPSPGFCLHYPACILAGKKYAKTEMR